MLNRRQSLQSLPLGAAAGAAGPEKRPNIILLLADDMAYSDPGCYGGEVETPNLNRLAKDGAALPAPLC